LGEAIPQRPRGDILFRPQGPNQSRDQEAEEHMTTKSGTSGLHRLTLALFASAAMVGVAAADAAAQTLEESVRGALENNPEVDIVKTNRRAIDQELRQARAGYLPSLDFRGAAGPEWSDNNTTQGREGGSDTRFRTEAQLTLSQMLFDGFATRSEVERQQARIDSAAYRVEEAAEFTALNAIEAHLDILRNQEIVRFNEQNISQHERIFSQVGELERAGRGDIADVVQTESRLARAFDTLAVSRGSLADAIARYQRTVGSRPGLLEDAEAPVGALPPSPEDAANLASVNSPTVLIAAADIDVASAEMRASRAGFYPRFDVEVGGGLNRNIDGADGRDNDLSGLVVMRYNLYRGGADIALEREAFHRANEARAVLANSRRLAEQEARFSYNALDTARARTDALTAKAEAQRRTRDAYAQQFEIGQRQLLDLLDAENELFLNRVELTTAVYTERFATYRVLAVVGDLLNTLEVVAPREAISVHRSLQDLKTPEVIEQNAGPLADPQSEPRPLRGVERGEPAQDQLDMAPLINRPPAGPGPGAALPVEPAATMADIPAAAGIVAQLDQPVPGAPTVLRLTDSEASAVSGTSAPATLPAAGASPTSDSGGFFGRLFRRQARVD
jgi:outer membrane protein, adhesin transport system